MGSPLMSTVTRCMGKSSSSDLARGKFLLPMPDSDFSLPGCRSVKIGPLAVGRLILDDVSVRAASGARKGEVPRGCSLSPGFLRHLDKGFATGRGEACCGARFSDPPG